MKRLSRITLTIIALILTVCMVSSCGIINIIANYVVSTITQTGPVNFDTLKYVRPNFNKIHTRFDDFLSDLKAGRTGVSLQVSLSEAYTLFNDAQSQYAIAQISYYNNVNDDYAKTESEYCAEEFAKLQVKLTQVYAAIVEYGQSDTLLVGWTDEDFENLTIQKKLYDDEYIKLQAEISKLQNQYLDLQSNVEIVYKTNRYTIDEVIELFNKGEIDASLRQKLVLQYYTNLSEQATPIYIKLITSNNRIAEKAGFASYREYANRFDYSRDYTTEEIELLYHFVKTKVPALYNQTVSKINTTMISTIYQKPYQITDYNAIFNAYFDSVSPQMKEAYQFMQLYNLSSIGNKSGMQQAGFTTYLPSYEMPYIYLYTRGTVDDISSFVHEFGHFFAFYKNGFESDSIVDVSEIHSQANELLFLNYYDLTTEERINLSLYKIAEMYQTVIEGCTMDEFQHYVHENISKLKTFEDFNDAFEDIAIQYHYNTFYQGIPFETLWAAITHNFVAPFYYLSYAVSAIPSLEIYQISLENVDKAKQIYLNVLDETGYRSYKTVLSDNALTTPFEEKTYTELSELPGLIHAQRTSPTAHSSLPKPYHFLGLAA